MCPGRGQGESRGPVFERTSVPRVVPWAVYPVGRGTTGIPLECTMLVIKLVIGTSLVQHACSLESVDDAQCTVEPTSFGLRVAVRAHH